MVPERLVGFGRHQRSLARDVVIAVDQSGSMAGSVVHASVFACVLARLPTLRTSLVAFDTAVADLTPLLADPVDVLFGVQLGGGTDIGGALGYCRQLVTRPARHGAVLVSDLFEGGNPARCGPASPSWCATASPCWCCWRCPTTACPPTTTTRPRRSPPSARPCSACTPDEFPELLAAALETATCPSGGDRALPVA